MLLASPSPRRRGALILAAVVALAGPPAAALAQDASGLVDISADELEVQNNTCIFTWRGRAEATRGQARLFADVMLAHFRPKAAAKGGPGAAACGDLLRIEAHGSVRYITARGQRVRGDDGLYDPTTEDVTITGDVVAVDGQNVLRGERMTFNNETGLGRVTGAPSVRPRGVFYPSENKGAAAQP